MTLTAARFESPLPVSADEAWKWHMRRGAIDRMLPPWQKVQVRRAEPIAPGSITELELGPAPFSIRWIAEHTGVDEGRSFTDRQTAGPFQSWIHEHQITATSETTSLLRDAIDYSPPLGALGSLLGGSIVRRKLEQMFAYRHRTLVSDLALQQRYRQAEPLRIAITGASGLVGRSLVAFLSNAGHDVIRMIRSGEPATDEVLWDAEHGIVDTDKMEGLDAVIHLAGENIAAGRWSEARKKAIRDSRVQGTAALVESLSRLSRPPRMFLGASAIGFYGETGDHAVDETTEPGSDFLSRVCREWESEAARAALFAERVVHLRFGIILTPAGGALAKMLPPFRFGAGGRLGSGHQFMSWVSLDDVLGAVLHCLATPSIDGPVNVVAPDARSNRSFTKALGKALARPTIAPLPAAAIKILFGEMGEAMLLASTRVAPGVLEASGYEFVHPDLSSALEHCLGRSTRMPGRAPAEQLNRAA